MKRIEKTAQNSHPQQPLICEEFPVRKDSKKKSLSNFSVPEKNSSPKSNDANEEIFALLKSFDLNYKFGPCIGTYFSDFFRFLQIFFILKWELLQFSKTNKKQEFHAKKDGKLQIEMV
eukprot:Sdes_comp20627_c0_seq2m15764